MKNKIYALSLVFIMILSAFPASVMGAGEAESIKVPTVAFHDGDFLYNGEPLENDEDTSDAIGKRSYTLDSGLAFSEYRGFVDTVDDLGKGNSLRIGVTDETNVNNNHSINIPLAAIYPSGATSGAFSLKMDVYFDEKTDFSGDGKPYGNDSFYMQFYGNKPARQRALVWDQKLYTEISTDGNNTLDTTTNAYDYEEKTWYTIQMDVDWTISSSKYTYKYDAYVSLGENGEMVKVAEDVAALTSVPKVTHIRFYSPILKDFPAWAAVDNIILSSGERDMPTIKSLAYGNSFTEIEDGGVVEYSAEKIGINLTDFIEGVEDGDVLLYRVDGEGKIPCDLIETSYDSDNYRIVIVPAEPLEQKTNYEIVLTEGVEVSWGYDMPIEQTAAFITDEEPVERTPIDDKDFLYYGSPLTNANADSNPTTLDSGLLVSKYSGYTKSVPVGNDASRGNSLVLGIKESADNLPSLNIPIDKYQTVGKSGNLRLDFDYYINSKPDTTTAKPTAGNTADLTNSAFRLGFYGVDAKAVYWHTKMKDNYGKEYDYEEKTWYKASFYLSWVPAGDVFQYSFDVYIGKYDENGVCGEMEQLGSTKNVKNSGKATQLRFYAPKFVNGEKWVAFDNVSLTETKDVPDVIGFGTRDEMVGFTGIDCSQEIIGVYLNESINSVSKEQVSLKQNGVEVPLEKVGYNSDNNVILIVPEEKLSENTSYVFEMSSSIEVWQGVQMGRQRKAEFTTTTSGVSVTDINVEFSGDDAIVTASASNIAEDAKKAYFIVSVWEGNKFIKQKVEIIQLQPQNTDTVTVTAEDIASGQTVSVYVWDNVFGAEMLTNKIITKTK